jgi:hypothetical protein
MLGFHSFEPSELELKYFARKLGADDTRHPMLRQLLATLPRSWSVVTHAEDGALLYINQDTGQLTWEHPRLQEISCLLNEVNENRGVTDRTTDIETTKQQHQTLMTTLKAEAEAAKHSLFRHYMNKTSSAEAEIKEHLAREHAERIRQMRAEAEVSRRVEEAGLHEEMSRLSSEHLQMSRHTEEDEDLMAVHQWKTEETRFKNELKALRDSLQHRRLEVAAVVAQSKQHRTELEAKRHQELQSLTQEYVDRKIHKLVTLENNAKRYSERAIVPEINALQRYVEAFQQRLDETKTTLRKQFEAEIEEEIRQLDREYRAAIVVVRGKAETRLAREAVRSHSTNPARQTSEGRGRDSVSVVGYSAETADLLKSKEGLLQEWLLDNVLLASTSLSKLNGLSHLQQEIGAVKLQLSDADLKLEDRENDLHRANEQLQELQGANEAELEIRSEPFPGRTATVPALQLKQCLSDRGSLPTSTKASTMRHLLYRNPSHQQQIYNEDVEEALKRSMRDKHLSCDGGMDPSASLPNLRQSLKLYSALLSRGVWSTTHKQPDLLELGALYLGGHERLGCIGMQGSKTRGIRAAGVRARRKYVERRAE